MSKAPTTASSLSSLSVKNLRIAFNKEGQNIDVIRSLSFEIEAGKTLALVGESGCGKSIMAQSILGLLPNNCKILGGSIKLDGYELTNLSLPELRKIRGKDVGFIFQDPMTSLNPTMTIGEQISEVLIEHFSISYQQAQKRALNLLDQVGISQGKDRLSQYPHEFSGGMRQRVMIAIALACNPKLLIADEPTTALDVTIQAQILKLIKTLQGETGSSVLIISHDLSVVAGIADHVAVMYAGQIIESATVSQLYSSPQHPYTQALLSAIPTLASHNRRLETIPGQPPDLKHIPSGCSFSPRCPYAMKVCESYEPSLQTTLPMHMSSCHLHHELAKRQKEKFTAYTQDKLTKGD